MTTLAATQAPYTPVTIQGTCAYTHRINSCSGGRFNDNDRFAKIIATIAVTPGGTLQR